MSYVEAISRVAAHYDREYYVDRLANYVRSAAIQRTFVLSRHITSTDAVIDFGCGDATVLEALPGSRKAGVEINPHARALALEKGFDIRGSIEEFDNELFDCVVSSHCLEHVVSPIETLTGLRKLLRSNGKLILNLPMNDCRDWRQRNWRPHDINQHLFAWTPLTLGNMLSVAGFEPLDVRIHPYTYPSRLSGLATLSPRGYHWLARLYNVVRPRPQLLALAKPRAA